MVLPVRVQAEVLEHLQIFFHGLIQRGEVVADHERARPGREDHALEVAQVHGAPTGDHDFLTRQHEAPARDGFQYLHRRQRREFLERRAGDGVEDVDGADVRADLAQRQREVAAVLARLAHADDAAGANLQAGFLQVADGLDAILVSMRRAGLREEAARAFEVVPVAFEARALEAIRNSLVLDDAERGVGPRLAGGLQLRDALAHFVEHRAFLQTLPRRDQTDGGHAVAVRFLSGRDDRLGVNKAILRRGGLVEGGLRAEAAILRARAGLGVDDGAEMNLVPLELLADAVGPRHQLEDVGGVLQAEEPQRLVAVNAPAVEDALPQFGKAFVFRRVKRVQSHG